MNRYLIDGRFLSSLSTGVDRYADQILRELDVLCKGMDISILVPANAKQIPAYRNIKIFKSRRSRFWTQVVFGVYARSHHMIPINLCNEVSVIAPKGVVCLHDVCYAESSEYFPYVDEFPREEVEWFLKVYKRICRCSKQMITVSNFSRDRIQALLGVPAGKIAVIGNGWQHFEKVGIDRELLHAYPQLKEKQFYFTLTSANKNKNVDWILKTSQYNRQNIFAVMGKNLNQKIDFKRYPNVIYIENSSDTMIKTLMTFCRAFIFPSYYEGFGIPPLEALSTGADVIVSKAASLPEIFGQSVHYIDPDNSDIRLDELLCEPTFGAEEVLNKYSWAKSAGELYDLLKNMQ